VEKTARLSLEAAKKELELEGRRVTAASWLRKNSCRDLRKCERARFIRVCRRKSAGREGNGEGKEKKFAGR